MDRHVFINRSLKLLFIGCALSACRSEKFQAPMKLGGNWVSAEKLNHGYDVYMNNCLSCHGVYGDGKGPASQGQYPQPRNFQQGLFKFANVPAGDLPSDADLKRTIRYGLRGTGMLPWDLQDNDLDSVIQYIKTFSPVWQEKKSGEAVAVSKDPWGSAHASEAILQGEKIYNGLAQCYSCHPSYQSLDKINADAKEITGQSIASIRPKPYLSTLLETEYKIDGYKTKAMPPDFTKTFIKTGGEIERTYEVIGVGIGGTPMPTWKGLLTTKGDPDESERNQWALAYYVNHLYQLKFDLQARKKFFDDLNERRAKYDRYDDTASPPAKK